MCVIYCFIFVFYASRLGCAACDSSKGLIKFGVVFGVFIEGFLFQGCNDVGKNYINIR